MTSVFALLHPNTHNLTPQYSNNIPPPTTSNPRPTSSLARQKHSDWLLICFSSMFQLSTSTENQNDQNVNGSFFPDPLLTMPGTANQDEQNNRDIE